MRRDFRIHYQHLAQGLFLGHRLFGGGFDQMMGLCWKLLVPLSLVVFCAAAVVAIH